ncbi:TPA: nucleotidyltransferase domain-containing protein [Candidatus Woesearchaeota archaeon]|nr:nucleotidyltransferase domain-containing protein [Candidatus Woesearchaeota archaeon]
MKQLAKKLRKLLNDKDINDLIVFGSIAKNNLDAHDIDVAVISDKEIDRQQLALEIKNIAKKQVDLQIISLKDYDKFIWITLIREGYSIKHDRYLHEIYRIQPMMLYRYELKQLTPSKKVMFERAIKSFKWIEKLSNRVVLVPISNAGEFSTFLKNWDIDIEAKEYGLLPLVRKE